MPRGRNFVKKTHCARGHEFTPENSCRIVSRGIVGRGCKACRLIRDRIQRGVPPKIAKTRAKQMGKRIEW